jgi:hypothetical protein
MLTLGSLLVAVATMLLAPASAGGLVSGDTATMSHGVTITARRNPGELRRSSGFRPSGYCNSQWRELEADRSTRERLPAPNEVIALPRPFWLVMSSRSQTCRPHSRGGYDPPTPRWRLSCGIDRSCNSTADGQLRVENRRQPTHPAGSEHFSTGRPVVCGAMVAGGGFEPPTSGL